MKWPLIDMEEMIEKGLIKLGRGNVISKLDIAACPGTFPIYSSAKMNNGKFGEYGKYMFDQELITWSVDGGGQLFYRPKHKFSVTNVAGTLEILDHSQLDCKYLHYVLSDKHSRLKFDWISKAHPSVIRRLYKEIPLPPLDEQIRISHLLGKVEELIAKRKQHLQQLDILLKSVFLEMFGDPVRNEMGWPRDLLGNLTRFITDGKHGDCKDNPESGYYFISAKDIHDGVIDYSQARQIVKEEFEEVHRRTNLQTNDLVMVNTGATIGKMAIVRPNNKTTRTTFQKSVAVIKPKIEVLNVVFLKSLFEIRLRDLVKASSGSAQQNLLLSQMRKIPVFLPPIDLQTRFADIAERIESIKSHYQQSLTNFETLYDSLSQLAFKGDLDLSRLPLPNQDIDSRKAQSEKQFEKLKEAFANEYSMSSPNQRIRYLKKIFEDTIYKIQSGKLSAIDEKFWSEVELDSLDYMNDDGETEPDKFFTPTEYDEFKQWVFKAIQTGKFVQHHDEEITNRIVLKNQGS